MFYIVTGSMGLAGDETYEIVSANNEDQACKEVYEELAQNISAFAEEEFETIEEAEVYMEENGY